MIPFFFMLAFSDQSDPSNGPQTLNLAMIGSVAASVSGLMTGGLYLFLKSNTLSTIGPKNKAGEYERQRMKHTIRRYGSNASDPDFNGHMMQPVAGPRGLRSMNSEASLISNEKEDEAGLEAQSNAPASSEYNAQHLNPLRSNPSLRIPRAPEPAQMSSSGIGHMRKRSYSLFPNGNPSLKSSATLLPSTTYTPMANARPIRDAESALDNLKPPPSIRNLAMGRFGHRRDSSMISSATVQIGLRLSNINDMLPMPAPIDPDVISLECPKEKKQVGRRPSPLTTSEPAAALTLDTTVSTIPDASPKRNPVKDARMKTLPPVPIPGQAITTDDGYSSNYDDEEDEEEEQVQTLSPTVYNSSPTKPKPATPGFTLPSTRFNASNSPRSPPRRTATGDAPQTKADWI
jgi:hypothetical protein